MTTKNRKRGVSFLELVITVAMIGILVSIVGPVLRYYLKLGNRYSSGLLEKVELDGTYRKIEEIIGSISLNDKWGNLSSGTKNAGIGVRDNFNNSISVKLSTFQGQIMSSNGQSRRTGNTAYVLVPVFKNGTLRESYHAFRFLNKNGQTGLYYSNSLESDGSVALLSKQSIVPFKSEELYLPSGTAIQELVPNASNNSNHNYFIEVGGGVLIHLEYYKDPKAANKNDPNNIITVEKLFLKRGEV